MATRLDQMGEGFVYMLRSCDDDLANRVKVGLSINCEIRRRQLYTTGVTKPFYIHYAWAVSNMAFAEQIAHKALEDYRVVSSREFFYIYTPEMALSLFGQLKPSTEDDFRIGIQALVDQINLGFQVNRTDLNYYAANIDELDRYSKEKRTGEAKPLF